MATRSNVDGRTVVPDRRAEYGDSCADYYDQLYTRVERGLVEVLASLSPGGRALELGLATGRVASRLAAIGVEVHGIDVSAAMLAQFRARTHPGTVHAARGDFCSLPYLRQFDLAYALVSTIHLLPTSEQQAGCFASVASALRPGGRFLVEADRPQACSEGAEKDIPIHTADGMRMYRVRSHVTTPVELDVMAGRSGLHLESRWSNWQRAGYTMDCVRHISVYRAAHSRRPSGVTD